MTGVWRDVWIAKFYFVEEFRAALRIERWKSNYHFIDERSETPPVDGLAMTLFIENFRSKILRSSANRIGIIISDIHFGKTKVSEPQISLFIDQNVFRLETE